MFYYYGRKRRFSSRYPVPQYEMIIEPFAGSAGYSLHDDNWKKEILLVEKDERVVDIWRWLIEEASAETIKSLPELTIGERSAEFFQIIHGVSAFDGQRRSTIITPIIARNWEASKRFMAENIDKVRHWKVKQGDYTDAPNVEATWFIDPPYKGKPGKGYRHNSTHLDYDGLTDWVLKQRGQLIVCEGKNGDYLPFEALPDINGVAGKKSTELIYHRPNLERAA